MGSRTSHRAGRSEVWTREVMGHGERETGTLQVMGSRAGDDAEHMAQVYVKDEAFVCRHQGVCRGCEGSCSRELCASIRKSSGLTCYLMLVELIF